MKKRLKLTLLTSAFTLMLAFAGTPVRVHAADLPAQAAATPAQAAATPVQAAAGQAQTTTADSAQLPGTVPAADPAAAAAAANQAAAVNQAAAALPATVPAAPISWQGKKLSVLGDSISTYTGTMPADYNIYYPESGDLTAQSQTWWGQVLTNTGMVLCSNASSANTNMTGNSMAMDGSAPGCSFRRIMDLRGKDGSAPDVIIIYMGINDFSRSRTVGSFTAPSAHAEGEVMTFSDSYEMMLQKIKAFYPAASVYCCTLLERSCFDGSTDAPATNLNGNTVADFNTQIRKIATAYNASVIDLYNCGINYTNLNLFTVDGIHPTRIGAGVVAQCVTQALMQ